MTFIRRSLQVRSHGNLFIINFHWTCLVPGACLVYEARLK